MNRRPLQCSFSILVFVLFWICSGLIHPAINAMSSYVQLPCCSQKLFPPNHPLPLHSCPHLFHNNPWSLGWHGMIYLYICMYTYIFHLYIHIYMYNLLKWQMSYSSMNPTMTSCEWKFQESSICSVPWYSMSQLVFCICWNPKKVDFNASQGKYVLVRQG